MRPSFTCFIIALLGAAAALLTGCCANNTCNCDQLADAILLRFNVQDTTGTKPTGYQLSEVDTIRIVRYRLLGATAPDTVLLTRPKSRAATDIVISNTAPFPLSGTQKVNAYRYIILLTDRHRRAPQVRQRYDLTNIRLAGRFQADGCCTCYENTTKTADLSVSAPNTNTIALTTTPIDLKQVIELRRPE